MRKALIPTLFVVFGLALLLVAGCGEEETTTTTAVAPATTAATSSTGETPATTAPSGDTTATPATVSSYEKGKWKLIVNMYLPPTHLISITTEAWEAEITKRTNGAVEFQHMAGASLTPPNKVYDGVVSGTSDIGFSYFAATVGTKPVSELLDYPLGITQGWVSAMLANAYYDEFKPAELDDVHVLSLYASGPQLLFTTEKPVKALEDVKGMVVRSTGVGVEVIKALGGEGYGAPQSEGYELMSKGVVQGNLAPLEVLKGFKLGDVAKSVTESYSSGTMAAFFMAMNKDTWADLPPDIQQVFTDVSQEWREVYAKVASALDYDGVEYYKSLGGDRQIITLSEEESARWKAAVKPVLEKKLAALQAAGFTEDYLGFLEAKIKELEAKAPSPAECSAWVKQNIKAPSK